MAMAGGLRRSMLFVPGSSPKMIAKGPTVGADSVIFDLEDGVAASEKETARALVVEAVVALRRNAQPADPEILIRINSLDTPIWREDLEAAAKARPDAVMVPKSDAAQTAAASAILDRIEAELGYPPGCIRLFPAIESARALEDVRAVAEASSRIEGIFFGAEDYSADMGLVRTAGGAELSWARSRIAVLCRARGIDAVDSPCVDVYDRTALDADIAAAKAAGMTGKAVIHPGQVAPVNEAFAPTRAEIEWARRLLAIESEMAAGGKGAYLVDGRMVDAPIVRKAERILARARLAGLD